MLNRIILIEERIRIESFFLQVVKINKSFLSLVRKIIQTYFLEQLQIGFYPNTNKCVNNFSFMTYYILNISLYILVSQTTWGMNTFIKILTNKNHPRTFHIKYRNSKGIMRDNHPPYWSKKSNTYMNKIGFKNTFNKLVWIIPGSLPERMNIVKTRIDSLNELIWKKSWNFVFWPKSYAVWFNMFKK